MMNNTTEVNNCTISSCKFLASLGETPNLVTVVSVVVAILLVLIGCTALAIICIFCRKEEKVRHRDQGGRVIQAARRSQAGQNRARQDTGCNQQQRTRQNRAQTTGQTQEQQQTRQNRAQTAMQTQTRQQTRQNRAQTARQAQTRQNQTQETGQQRLQQDPAVSSQAQLQTAEQECPRTNLSMEQVHIISPPSYVSICGPLPSYEDCRPHSPPPKYDELRTWV